MSNSNRGSAGEERARVRWTARGKRGWCPGAARQQAATSDPVTTGWTSFLHWQGVQGMIGSLRERLQQKRTQPQAPAPVVAREVPSTPELSQPAAALPSLRRRSATPEPALEAWLDETPD